MKSESSSHDLADKSATPKTPQKSKQAQLESEIIHTLVPSLRESSDSVSDDIMDKQDAIELDIQHLAKSQPYQAVLLSMKDVAYSRILVRAHRKSQLRLVVSLCKLAKAYFDFACYEQAKQHLTAALSKIDKFANELVCKRYQCFMLTLLSECHCKTSAYDEALQLLDRVMSTVQSHSNSEQQSFFHEYLIKTECFMGQHNYRQALEALRGAESNLGLHKGPTSRMEVEVLLLKYRIFSEQKQQAQSLQHLNQAISILSKCFSSDKDQVLCADLHRQLQKDYEKMDKHQQALLALQNRYSVLENLYGYADKRCLSEKRDLAAKLLKIAKVDEALEELDDLLDIETKVYGASSLEVAKTHRALGSAFESRKRGKEAVEKYREAEKIYRSRGYPKEAKEILAKITAIQ